MRTHFCTETETIVFVANRDSMQGGAFIGPFRTFNDAFEQIDGTDIDELTRVIRIDNETMVAMDVTEDCAGWLVDLHGPDADWLPAFCDEAKSDEWQRVARRADRIERKMTNGRAA